VHDGSGRIVVQNLSKQFGPVAAVQNLSFTVEPGSVTGFLGPNGSGKTTTLRMLLGLVAPSAGSATINGNRYQQLGNPARIVGSVLDSGSLHSRRSARNHLRIYAAAIGVADSRVEETIGLVGLSPAIDRKVGGFSLGMRQRLSLATALLGDPQVLVLDEPANGLDPEGIAWLRQFLRGMAAQGRTVLISSHLLAEVEQTIDQVVIVSHGVTRYYGSVEHLRQNQQSRVLVQSADNTALAQVLQQSGYPQVTPTQDGRVAVSGATTQQVGDIAAGATIAVYGMQEEQVDLEQLFFQLTNPQYTGMPPQQPQRGWAQPQQPPQQQPGQPPWGGQR